MKRMMAVRDGRISIKLALMMLMVVSSLHLLLLPYTKVLLQPSNYCSCQYSKDFHLKTRDDNFRHEHSNLTKHNSIINTDKERIDKVKEPRGHIKVDSEVFIQQPLDINPRINASRFRCASNLILIYVYSAPGNFENRETVRHTYGSVKSYGGLDLKILFFIGGLTEEANTTQYYRQLLAENRKYKDVVQDRGYIDAYRNLTLKGMSAIRWIYRHCPTSHLVLKVDDDTMVNPYNLIDYLKNQNSSELNQMICKKSEGVRPDRNTEHKYYVLKIDYPPEKYPPYCQGYGYLFPAHFLPTLIQGFSLTRPIVLEDVYITGVAAESVGIKQQNLPNSHSVTFGNYAAFLSKLYTRPYLIFIGHVHENDHAITFWKFITFCKNSTCKHW